MPLLAKWTKTFGESLTIKIQSKKNVCSNK